MGAHALLSPSAAHRWMNCPAAPNLEAGVPDEGSSFAAEGTLAHAYCALKLKQYLGLATDQEQQEIEALNDQYHTGEMDEYTDAYVTIVLEKLNAARALTADAMLLVETRLDFSSHIPEAFGTSDAIIIADGTMEVIDFKYGKGVKVSAFKNPQMMIYALGAYDKFNFEYSIDRVRMTIIQPRIDNLSEYELSTDDLLDWADNTLAPAAEKAYRKNNEQKPGEWCQFCKVKNICRALAGNCKNLVNGHQDPALLTPEELATEVLPYLDLIAKWASSVENFALQQAVNGVSIPGYKLVAGRSNRKITDADGAAKALEGAGYEHAKIWKPQELETITNLEKLVGKKQFAALCGDFIVKPEGKATLVPESDKRPALNTAAEDFKDINA